MGNLEKGLCAGLPNRSYYRHKQMRYDACMADGYELLSSLQKTSRLRDYRRTGRTTEIFAVAMADLLTTGECILQDHVEGETEGNLHHRSFVDRFFDAYEGFLRLSGNGELNTSNYEITKVSSRPEPHRAYIKFYCKIKMLPNTPEWNALQARMALKYQNQF